MKLFGTDFKQKYVIAEVNGKEVMISFYDTFWKGIHNISFRIDGEEKQITIKSTYPGFVRRIKEAVLLTKIELKHAIDRVPRTTEKTTIEETLQSIDGTLKRIEKLISKESDMEDIIDGISNRVMRSLAEVSEDD